MATRQAHQLHSLAALHIESNASQGDDHQAIHPSCKQVPETVGRKVVRAGAGSCMEDRPATAETAGRMGEATNVLVLAGMAAIAWAAIGAVARGVGAIDPGYPAVIKHATGLIIFLAASAAEFATSNDPERAAPVVTTTFGLDTCALASGMTPDRSAAALVRATPPRVAIE